MNSNKSNFKWRLVRISWILFFATIIFISSSSYKMYEEVGKVTDPIPLNNNQTGYFYKLLSQEIALENVDSILSKIMSNIKYKEICFVDEGSSVKVDAPVIVSVNNYILYDNSLELVSSVSSDNNLLQQVPKCMIITNKYKVTWQWGNNQSIRFLHGTASSLVGKQAIFTPKLNTYFKTSLTYLILAIGLSIFYAGVFLWALSRIWNFIQNGFA